MIMKAIIRIVLSCFVFVSVLSNFSNAFAEETQVLGAQKNMK